MERSYKQQGNTKRKSYIKVRFGKENDIENAWKSILKEKDKIVRHELIDQLIEVLENNQDNNGFFGRTEVIETGNMHGFFIDDPELYYKFFDNLELLRNLDGVRDGKDDGLVIREAIKLTITQYAGGNGVNREERLQATEHIITDDGDLSFPSIRKQKGKRCFYCTEQAAISHNLWLITGKSSYFCFTNCDNFGATDEVYKNDTHNFTIVEYDGEFRLFDIAMDNFALLENDCIEKLLSGRGLRVENVNNPGVYAPNDFETQNC